MGEAPSLWRKLRVRVHAGNCVTIPKVKICAKHFYLQIIYDCVVIFAKLSSAYITLNVRGCPLTDSLDLKNLRWLWLSFLLAFVWECVWEQCFYIRGWNVSHATSSHLELIAKLPIWDFTFLQHMIYSEWYTSTDDGSVQWSAGGSCTASRRVRRDFNWVRWYFFL